jgi:hypothetical protein
MMASVDRHDAALAAARLVCTPPTTLSRTMYSGNGSVQRKPDFFSIREPSETSRHTVRGKTFEPASPPLVKAHHAKQRRAGVHGGYGDGSDPLAQNPIDPLALQTMKIRDPVAYHCYVNQRPWVTQSTVVGEYLRKPSPPRLPSEASATLSKRDVLRSLRATSPVAVGASRNPAAMDDVSTTRQGFLPSPSRGADDMASVARVSYINPKTLPEPPACRQVEFHDRAFYTKHPVDTTALEALSTMRNLDGTLATEKPPAVHPAIWALESTRDRALSFGNPHAHKTRTRSSGGGFGSTNGSASATQFRQSSTLIPVAAAH